MVEKLQTQKQHMTLKLYRKRGIWWLEVAGHPTLKFWFSDVRYAIEQAALLSRFT